MHRGLFSALGRGDDSVSLLGRKGIGKSLSIATSLPQMWRDSRRKPDQHGQMIRMTLLAIVLFLSACGGDPRETVRGPAADEITVISSNFDDSDPTDWPGRSPDRYPVHGIDVSRFQTGIDWPTARCRSTSRPDPLQKISNSPR